MGCGCQIKAWQAIAGAGEACCRAAESFHHSINTALTGLFIEMIAVIVTRPDPAQRRRDYIET